MIVNRQRRVRISVEPLQAFYERVRNELRFPADGVTVELISDAAMARLNRRFRHKRGPTDVLSFPVNSDLPAGSLAEQRKTTHYVGDIAISLETARRNARRFSRTFTTEVRILILHGMLHLAGYDHETDHGEMNRREARLRHRLGIAQ